MNAFGIGSMVKEMTDGEENCHDEEYEIPQGKSRIYNVVNVPENAMEVFLSRF